MPFLTVDVTTEHGGLAVFAQQQIRQVATTLQGVDREQLTATPSVSSFSLGALARHVLEVADGIAQQIEAVTAATATPGAAGSASNATDENAPTYDAEDYAAALRGDDGAGVQPSDTAQSLIDDLEAAGARLATAIENADLDAPVPTPAAPWFSGEERWTVRWIALHSIEEVARHAGHADIIRESVDAKIAYELNALADGEPWPPPGW